MFRQAACGVMLVLLMALGGGAHAAPYAAYVVDMRDGRVLHEENAHTRLHPASLTKMMTLYLVFDAVERGALDLDQKIPISRNAAAEPPSKLGLRAGSSIELRYLIRASSVKSANDAATALAEAVAGSEAAFTRRMTATARAMGMSRTTFKNAHGLTASGHLSTAHDMAILARRLFYDFPEYYNLFGRLSTNAKLKTVYNTNRRLLSAYSGADGIKTGYTRAAGFNLAASAQRGSERVLVVMFGGNSSASRNRKVAELMDLGFARMPARVAVRKPPPMIVPSGDGTVRVARVNRAPRPMPRSLPVAVATAAAIAEDAIPMPPERAGAMAAGDTADPAAIADAVARAAAGPGMTVTARTAAAGAAIPRPRADLDIAASDGNPRTLAKAQRPRARPRDLPAVATTQSAAPVVAEGAAQEADWVLQLEGKYNRSQAERLLLTTALQEMEALDGAKREMTPAGSPGWYHARFIGLSEDAAATACARLAARQTACEVMQGG